jgi:uncharacterized membrane protein
MQKCPTLVYYNILVIPVPVCFGNRYRTYIEYSTKTWSMERIIIISVLVVIAGIFIVLRLKQRSDKKNPPHSPLR